MEFRHLHKNYYIETDNDNWQNKKPVTLIFYLSA